MGSKTDMRAGFIKVKNPRQGISKAEYERLCHSLGVKPDYSDVDPQADAGKAGAESPDDRQP